MFAKYKYKKMKKYTFLIYLAGFSILSACSTPPDVVAERPLINQNLKGFSSAQLLPESLWVNLNNAYKGVAFESEFGQFLIENTYISAMGHWCVSFELSSTKNTTEKQLQPVTQYYGQDRRACKQKDAWFFIAPLMESNNYSSLSNSLAPTMLINNTKFLFPNIDSSFAYNKPSFPRSQSSFPRRWESKLNSNGVA